MNVIVITGQTATGKTALAYEYAKKLGGELINADARQVYKYLDIISSKDLYPTFPTHLYDIVDPKDPFSSYEWTRHALKSIEILTSQNKTPIIVGGSYLYLKHLLYGIETEGIQPDWELRKVLDTKSVNDLQTMLKKISSHTLELLNQSDRNNPRRLMRKIEIESYRRRSGFSFHLEGGIASNYKVECIGLRFESKEDLVKSIEKRVAERIEMGAIGEVERLLKMGYTEKDPGLQTIGYQQIIKYLQKKISKDQAVAEWTAKEIQYAKRQYTFMKTDENIVWRQPL